MMILFALLVLTTFGTDESDPQEFMKARSALLKKKNQALPKVEPPVEPKFTFILVWPKPNVMRVFDNQDILPVPSSPNAMRVFDNQDILLLIAKFLTPQEFICTFRPLNRKTSNTLAESYLSIETNFGTDSKISHSPNAMTPEEFVCSFRSLNRKTSNIPEESNLSMFGLVARDLRELENKKDHPWIDRYNNISEFLSVQISKKNELLVKKFYNIPISWETILKTFLQLCESEKSLVLYSFVHKKLKYMAVKFELCFKEIKNQPYLKITYSNDDSKFDSVTTTFYIHYFLEVNSIIVNEEVCWEQGRTKRDGLENYFCRSWGASEYSRFAEVPRSQVSLGLISEQTFFPRAVLLQFKKLGTF